MSMQKRANLARRAVRAVMTAIVLACLLVETPSGVETSLPSGRVVNLDGAVRVDSMIAVHGSRSLEG